MVTSSASAVVSSVFLSGSATASAAIAGLRGGVFASTALGLELCVDCDGDSGVNTGEIVLPTVRVGVCILEGAATSSSSSFSNSATVFRIG